METGNYSDFEKFIHSLSDVEIRQIIYDVLLALDYAHSKGIMHRDIKPGNIMINSKTKQVTIIDWGNADYYEAGKEFSLSVGTTYFKSPELISNLKRYDYSLDVWSLGCIHALLLF